MPTDFAPGSAPAAATPLFSGGALLDAEKLDCYRLAVEFQALAARLLPKRGYSSLRDQLDVSGRSQSSSRYAGQLFCSSSWMS